MNNQIIKEKTWWKKNWKWVIPTSIVCLMVIVFFSSGLNGITTDLVKAYADQKLYEDAITKIKANQKATEILGDIQPIDKLAILEGSVSYSNDNSRVNSNIRIVGTTAKGKLDITAHKVDNNWNYTLIEVRIKKPKEKQHTITIVSDH